MNSFKAALCAVSLLTAISVYSLPAMAFQNNSIVRAGFTDLPLRNCQGTYCGMLKKLAMGQQLKVIFNDTAAGWSQVEVVGSGEKGWICNENVTVN